MYEYQTKTFLLKEIEAGAIDEWMNNLPVPSKVEGYASIENKIVVTLSMYMGEPGIEIKENK